MKRLALAFAYVLMVGASGFATETAPVPQQTTETFGAWVVRCIPASESSGQHSCEALLHIKNKGTVLAEIAIGKDAKTQDAIIAGRTPLGVLISEPLRLKTSESKDAIEISYVTCIAQGCIARTKVPTAALQADTEKAKGSLELIERSGRTIKITLPMNGFKDALARLGLV